MKTFDLEQVNAVIRPLKEKLSNCAHGEGNSCETLDKHLDCCATICAQFTAALKEWAHDVFSGEVIFNSEAERTWRDEAAKLLVRAERIWRLGRKAEVPCFELPAQDKLASALWELNWLVKKWVTPKLSIGPAARVTLTIGDEQRNAIAKQICSLPPLARSEKAQ